MKADLLSLAERVEKAEGPDRGLDAEIAATCRKGAEEWKWAERYPAWEGRADGRVYLESGGPSFAATAYTASLDAALTLADDLWDRVEFGCYEGVKDKFWADIGLEASAEDCASKELAVLAACLRARAQAETSHD